MSDLAPKDPDEQWTDFKRRVSPEKLDEFRAIVGLPPMSEAFKAHHLPPKVIESIEKRARARALKRELDPDSDLNVRHRLKALEKEVAQLKADRRRGFWFRLFGRA